MSKLDNFAQFIKFAKSPKFAVGKLGAWAGNEFEGFYESVVIKQASTSISSFLWFRKFNCVRLHLNNVFPPFASNIDQIFHFSQEFDKTG